MPWGCDVVSWIQHRGIKCDMKTHDSWKCSLCTRGVTLHRHTTEHGGTPLPFTEGHARWNLPSGGCRPPGPAPAYQVHSLLRGKLESEADCHHPSSALSGRSCSSSSWAVLSLEKPPYFFPFWVCLTSSSSPVFLSSSTLPKWNTGALLMTFHGETFVDFQSSYWVSGDYPARIPRKQGLTEWDPESSRAWKPVPWRRKASLLLSLSSSWFSRSLCCKKESLCNDDTSSDSRTVVSVFKFMSIELVMPSNHLILCRPPLLLPSILPRIRVFSSELVLHPVAKVLASASASVLPLNIGLVRSW